MTNQVLLAGGIVLAAAFAASQVQAQTVEQLQEQIDILAQEIEAMKSQDSSSAMDKVHIGGYGEIHYNKYLESGNTNDEIDAHRFVLYFGYDFSDSVRFVSEFELEHSLAGDGKPGEVELEQAYIEFDTSGNSRLKGGIFLVPVGILNETHEPDTFYGVERNQLESRIVPATWWEAGAMFSHSLDGGLTYDIAAHSGLNMWDETSMDANAIRSGRQKVAEAPANKGAMTARLRYAGILGLDMAASVQYQQDVFQSFAVQSVPATLLEAHIRYSINVVTLTAQYAGWTFDDAIGVEAAEDQSGMLLEASWQINEHFGVFARHTEVDYNAGGSDLENREREDNSLGVNYWPVPNVVLKADYNDVSYDAGGDDKSSDTVNLGIGWSF